MLVAAPVESTDDEDDDTIIDDDDTRLYANENLYVRERFHNLLAQEKQAFQGIDDDTNAFGSPHPPPPQASNDWEVHVVERHHHHRPVTVTRWLRPPPPLQPMENDATVEEKVVALQPQQQDPVPLLAYETS